MIKIGSIFLVCHLAFFSLVGAADEDPAVAHTFNWTQEKMEAANILAQVAGPGLIRDILQVSGKIEVHPNHLAYVVPKVEGVVHTVYKNVGDSVDTGEIMALIESKEIASAKVAYLAALKKSQAQQRILQRETNLRKISAEQDFLDAQLAAEEALVHAAVAEQYLYSLGFTDQDLKKLAQEDMQTFHLYKLRAPISGKVVQRNLTQGESLEAVTKVFTVANFDQVWVEIQVAAGDVRHLQEGQPVEIVSFNGKRAHAMVSHFNPTIDEHTRKSIAVAVLENQNRAWRPGEFISAYIQTEQTPAAIVIPKEAVQHIKGEACVFVEQAERGFVPQVVRLGKMDGKNVEIVSGLKQGDIYAACHTFCLKADYEKEEGEH
jgi:membrane fusion protein, heavy metal efflux system